MLQNKYNVYVLTSVLRITPEWILIYSPRDSCQRDDARHRPWYRLLIPLPSSADRLVGYNDPRVLALAFFEYDVSPKTRQHFTAARR